MRVKSESEVAQSCPTLCDPMVCSLPGSSVHGISRQEYWSGLPLPSPKNNTTSNKKRPPGVCPKCKKGFHWLNECRSKFDKDGNALTTEAQQKQQGRNDQETDFLVIPPKLSFFTININYYKHQVTRKALLKYDSTQSQRETICGLYVLWVQRRQWHPTPVPLPGKSHGQRSLVGCSPWGG